MNEEDIFYLDDGADVDNRQFSTSIRNQSSKCRHVFFKDGGGDQKETGSEKIAAEIMWEKLNLFESELAPLNKLYRKETKDLGSDSARSFIRGTANQNTEKAFSPARSRLETAKISKGVNPNSAEFRSAMSEFETEKAGSSGENQTLADNSQEEEFVTGMQNINAIGLGESTKAQAGMSRLAVTSGKKAAQDAEDAWNKKARSLNTAGSAAGLAASEWG